MTDWQIESALLALHNITEAVGAIAAGVGVLIFVLFLGKGTR